MTGIHVLAEEGAVSAAPTDGDYNQAVADAGEIAFVPLTALRRLPLPVRDMVVGPIAERGHSALLFGAPGLGKTTAGATIAFAASAGRDWGPFTVSAPANVLYANFEDTRDELVRRFSGIATQFDGAEGAMDRLHLLNREGALRILHKGGDGTALTRHGLQLSAAIMASKPDLIVFDPLALTHDLDENLNADMAAVIETIQAIGREAKAAVIIVHHAKKATERSTGLDSVRGASSLAASVRSAWRLVVASGPDVRLECVKANNFPKPEVPTYLRQTGVTIGNGDSVGILVPLNEAPVQPEVSKPRRRA
jgi:hypothetical protein